MEDPAVIQHNQHIGIFLAGLMQENFPTPVGSTIVESVGMGTHQLAVA
jgi:hypothetical protein